MGLLTREVFSNPLRTQIIWGLCIRIEWVWGGAQDCISPKLPAEAYAAQARTSFCKAKGLRHFMIPSYCFLTSACFCCC